MNLTLHIWRQPGPEAPGGLKPYPVQGVAPDMSFLEMLDVLNEDLARRGEEPIAFDHDCREGICGACSLVINGRPHGPKQGTCTCQLHLRHFRDGDHITVEPFRAGAFPVLRDLIVDRRALDRLIQAGGFISTNVGSAPDAQAVPVSKEDAETAFEAAACIGCGACVAACPNASAMLFIAAKVSHLAHLPQGHPERARRVQALVAAMDREGFGHCTNIGECGAACPKQISLQHIAKLNREFIRAAVRGGPRRTSLPEG